MAIGAEGGELSRGERTFVTEKGTGAAGRKSVRSNTLKGDHPVLERTGMWRRRQKKERGREQTGGMMPNIKWLLRGI